MRIPDQSIEHTMVMEDLSCAKAGRNMREKIIRYVLSHEHRACFARPTSQTIRAIRAFRTQVQKNLKIGMNDNVARYSDRFWPQPKKGFSKPGW